MEIWYQGLAGATDEERLAKLAAEESGENSAAIALDRLGWLKTEKEPPARLALKQRDGGVGRSVLSPRLLAIERVRGGRVD
jgi:hypothetical protein